MKTTRLCLALAALFAWALGTAQPAYAADLFYALAEDGAWISGSEREDAGVLPRERRVAITPGLLSSTRAQVEHGDASVLSLNVDASLNFDVLLEHSAPTGWGYSLSGRVTGGPVGFVTLVVHDEAVAGYLWTLEGSYEIVPLGDGVHAVREVNEGADIQCGTAMAAGSPITAEARDSADDGSLVDILVVWTPAAEMSAGGENLVRAKIDLAIAFTNDAFRRSGIFTSLNLVGAEKVDYYEEGSFDDFHRLQDPQDGHLDDVLALRDAVGADLVHLFWGGAAGGGLAFVGGAFAASDSVLTFAHEIGHNFGVIHSRADEEIYSYQHAYVSLGHGCARTITTYEDCPGRVPGSVRTLPYYSSPALWDPRNGRPLGVSRFAAVRGVRGPADAVLTINRTRHDIANFRPSRGNQAGAGPPSWNPPKMAGPETSVNIPDANLRRAVEIALNKALGEPITRDDMASLTTLTASTLRSYVDEGEGVRDLFGMEHAVNLTSFVAESGKISDLSPLRDLQHLTYLGLTGNYVSDLTPVANLGSLRSLRLALNYISDIAPLVGLESLDHLDLSDNQVSDLSALAEHVTLASARPHIQPNSRP